MTSLYAHAGPEPALAEMLLDPVIRAVMQRDGVDDGALCRAIAIGRFRLGVAESSASAACVVRQLPCQRPAADCGQPNHA